MKKIDIDNHKLMYHPRRVADWLEGKIIYPIYIEIEPTSRCNHDCIYCGLDFARTKKTLDTRILLGTLEDFAKGGVKAVCYAAAGEPLLHKDFSLIVEKTKKLGIDVSYSTNGILFNRKKAEECLPYTSWIRFSVDAATKETHSKIHRTAEKDFSMVVNNLKDAVAVKKENNYETILGVQFLLIEENEKEAVDFVKLCKDIGVDNVQIKPYSQNPNSHCRLGVDYSKYNHLEEELITHNSKDFQVIFRAKRVEKQSNSRLYDICYGHSFFCIINANGNVAPCEPFYSNDEFSYGNIYERSFLDILNDKQRIKTIEKIKANGIKDCKRGCRLDIINEYLFRLKNPQPHDNFI